MPELRPFRAVRYTARAGNAADLLSPPYDVIGDAHAAALRARSAYNAVRLELPEGEESTRYSLAAQRLRAWLDEGVLERDREPAVYVYRQTFSHCGQALERWSLLAALRLSELERGEVLPHERTHGAPKRDRLALGRACKAQLSPVYLLAPDRRGQLLDGLQVAEGGPTPFLDVQTDDGIRHRLWRVEGGDAASLCHEAASAPLLIADGHHRYETGLALARDLADSEEAGWTLACIGSESDPGLLLLPTHRALRVAPPGRAWGPALGRRFRVEALSRQHGAGGGNAASGAAGEREEAGGATANRRLDAENGGADAERLAEALRPGSGELGLVVRGEEPVRLDPRPEAVAADGVAEAAARLGAVLFDRWILGELLGWTAEEAAASGLLSYHRDAREAVRAAATPRTEAPGAAFLMGPMRVSDVRAAVLGGERLPPKTTYFWPKIPSGLVFRLL